MGAKERAAIELKAISCRDLVIPLALFGKPPVYAVVSIGDGTGGAGRRQSQSTHLDRTGGRNPEWEQELRFDLAEDGAGVPLSSLLVEFEFATRRGVGGVLGDPVVGKAWVPLRDLREEYAAACGGGFRSVRYQVKSPDGKPTGDVTFLYRLKSLSQEVDSPAPAPVSPMTPSYSFYPPPPSPPAAADKPYAVQQPGAMYYHRCPAPPLSLPSDSYGYPPPPVYDFVGSGCVESWPAPPLRPPPPWAQPYGFPWKGHASAGDGWDAEGGAHRMPMYGSVPRYV